MESTKFKNLKKKKLHVKNGYFVQLTLYLSRKEKMLKKHLLNPITPSLNPY